MKKLIYSPVVLLLIAGCFIALAITGCGSSIALTDKVSANSTKDQPATPSSELAEESGKGMDAIKQTAAEGKYLFIFFSKIEDEQTLAMRKVFDRAMEKVADRAQWIAVNITDSSEKSIVAKFGVDRAPMPLVLAIAPNGAITGGFPTKVEEQELLGAFATPGTEKVMKQLQDGKLVFVCVQNDKTKSNEEAIQGVREFKSDARFAKFTEIVSLDPSDEKEVKFLTDLKVPTETKEAVTVFVVPPGQAIGKFEGATSKAALIELLSKANTGCGPGGCGPGGCGPKQQQ
jgi:hypothetical protein